ncbi:acetyl-CoA acetyltransferase [Bradyrhizobium sp. SSBR45G]|uniref:acetyl-CoA C-acetyltransferase n=1 Tax=unclassified Bradyrhizobium TaxID=2631580 RepID=UPI002342947B|nr:MULTISPECIES: acetyl-CoA C-acetyltransferase [unclassified Bradyrhizobium]GLH77141.1 acetyl-CoA acetyltransferase [Bradyrhizobium sp. SSBR45G]GLH83899.1 acetyl-CoA acetyltransferase [Bradyrhizobium sp. SSBR45R]
MSEAIIFDAIRTPRGKGRRDGALYEVGPVQLLAGLMQELERRTEIDTALINDVLIGCVQPYGEQGGVIAKTAALAAGWSWTGPGLQLNRYCGSGLDAVNLAAQKIRSGWDDLIVAGGVESMSRMGIGAAPSVRDHQPRLSFELKMIPQGVSADLLATLDGRAREDVDAYALRSQQLAAQARAEGRFDGSLVPVRDINGVVLLAADDAIRADATMEGLAKLKPSFAEMGEFGGFDAIAMSKYPQVEEIRHVHTAGNSSGIVDGAALMLIGSAEKGSELGLRQRARIIATAALGVEPTIMLTGPAPVAEAALRKAGLSCEDIDLYEVNEAFASVVLRFLDETKVPLAKVNVNGGAIALGHPLGASGCVLVGTLLDELERRELKRGLVTLCAADGMGVATVIERV